MAIVKVKSGNFRVDFRDATGRRFRKTFTTLAEARSYNKESLGDISKGDFVPPSAVTVLDAAKSWLARKAESNGYRHGTLQNWRTHIDAYIKPELGGLKIQQASIDQIETAALKWSEQTSPYTAN